MAIDGISRLTKDSAHCAEKSNFIADLGVSLRASISPWIKRAHKSYVTWTMANMSSNLFCWKRAVAFVCLWNHGLELFCNSGCESRWESIASHNPVILDGLYSAMNGAVWYTESCCCKLRGADIVQNKTSCFLPLVSESTVFTLRSSALYLGNLLFSLYSAKATFTFV